MQHRFRLPAVLAACTLAALAATGACTSTSPRPYVHVESIAAHADEPLSPNDPFWLYGPGTSYWDEQTDDGFPVERPSYGVDAIDAWTHNQGAGVIVAVVDTGFNTSSPELSGHLWTNPAPAFDDLHGANLVAMNGDIADPAPPTPPAQAPTTHPQRPARYGHGTVVAGLISSVAPQAQLMLLRVSSDSDPTEADGAAVLRAFTYAVKHGATVINLSLGSQSDCSASWGRAIRDAEAHNIVVVAAAGNEQSEITAPVQHCPTFGDPGTLAAASITQQGALSWFSNWGSPLVQVAAPGDEMELPAADGSTWPESGTSLSSPLTAGVVALVRAERPQATPAQVVKAITASAYPLASLTGKVASGGVVDAVAALNWIDQADLTAPSPPRQVSPATFRLRRRSVVIVRWDASSDNRALVGYRVSIDGRLRATVAPTVLSFSVRLGAGRHSWSVVAFDDAGNTSG